MPLAEGLTESGVLVDDGYRLAAPKNSFVFTSAETSEVTPDHERAEPFCVAAHAIAAPPDKVFRFKFKDDAVSEFEEYNVSLSPTNRYTEIIAPT